MQKPTRRPTRAWMSELLVPAVMLSGIVFYVYDVRALSGAALAFPGALIAILLLASLVLIGLAWTARVGGAPDQEHREPIVKLRAVAIVLIPLPLILGWRLIGALPVLFVLMLALQFVLGERRPLRAAILAALVAGPLTILFKTVFYVRLPDGLAGFGL